MNPPPTAKMMGTARWLVVAGAVLWVLAIGGYQWTALLGSGLWVWAASITGNRWPF